MHDDSRDAIIYVGKGGQSEKSCTAVFSGSYNEGVKIAADGETDYADLNIL